MGEINQPDSQEGRPENHQMTVSRTLAQAPGEAEHHPRNGNGDKFKPCMQRQIAGCRVKEAPVGQQLAAEQQQRQPQRPYQRWREGTRQGRSKRCVHLVFQMVAHDFCFPLIGNLTILRRQSTKMDFLGARFMIGEPPPEGRRQRAGWRPALHWVLRRRR